MLISRLAAPRLKLIALAAILVASGSVLVTAAPNPTSGTITEANPTITYTGGPLPAGNPGSTAGANPCPSVQGVTPTCESFDLTIDLPSDFDTRRPRDGLRIDLDAIASADMRLDLMNAAGTTSLQSSDGNGTSGGEQMSLDPAPGIAHYKVRVANFAGVTANYTVHIRLVSWTGTVTPPGACDATSFGAADPTCAGNPRYQNFYAPAGTSAQEQSQGEYNIGYNPHTGRIMNMNIGPIWRITPGEIKSGGANPAQPSGVPESCPELWEDVSDPTTDTGLDPILWTDQKSGRTFATNSTAGAATIFTDTDGGDPPANDNPNTAWTQAVQSANGGADHESIGSGPLPAALSNLATPQNQGEWVLYCSQDLYAPSQCQRSLTLGNTWETPYPATGTACAGLHGHLRVGPDGAGYLPVHHCNVTESGVIQPRQGGSITVDSSVSPWTEFTVEKTTADADGPAFYTYQQSAGADSSIGIDAANTIYYCYVNNEPTGIEGHVHVAVGKHTGTAIKWIRDVDVGASHGIVNAAETEAIGGSAGRAACGFLGTDKWGDYQAGTFTGMNWYAFVATTYDEGRTWVTVNATPNDPVQHNTGVWQGGGGGVNGNRNLLDFNEISMDEKGRVLYGYSDGCVTANCINKTAAQNDKHAYMRVARQVGGKTLLAAYDNSTDTTAVAPPHAPCLMDKGLGDQQAKNLGVTPTPASLYSTRPDDTVVHLHWRTPDNGGSDITNYDILRSTTKGGPYTLIGSTADASTSYDDTTSGTTPVLYYVVRANSQQAGVNSNEVQLALGAVPEDPCVPPGLTVLTDPSGDETGGQAAHDVRSLKISEPYRNSAADTITFTLKMTSLATLTPNTYWPIQFNVGATTYTARMSTFAPATTTAPAFEYYQGAANTAVPATTAADPASNFNADGTITIVVPRSGIGNPAVGTALNQFQVRISVNAGAGNVTPDNMPDDTTMPAGSYTVLGNGACRSNLPPIAALAVMPDSGQAPLDVTFDATGSSDPDTSPPADTIDSYTFNFGDGTPPVTQSTPTISHTYADGGSFFADVKVHSPRGDLTSTNKAEVEVEVAPLPPNHPPVAHAGADFSVFEGDTALLSGQATDPDNDVLTYAWTQFAGPPVPISNAATAVASFSAPSVTDDTPFGFRLTVKDPRGATSFDDVVVTVRSRTKIGDNAVGALPASGLGVLGLLGVLGRLARRYRRTRS